MCRVCINLQIGPSVAPRDSVALFVALDFNRNLIVRNSIQAQNWGVEETHGPPVALIRGQPFKLDILCDAYDYKVSLNYIIGLLCSKCVEFNLLFHIILDRVQWVPLHRNET